MLEPTSGLAGRRGFVLPRAEPLALLWFLVGAAACMPVASIAPPATTSSSGSSGSAASSSGTSSTTTSSSSSGSASSGSSGSASTGTSASSSTGSGSTASSSTSSGSTGSNSSSSSSGSTGSSGSGSTGSGSTGGSGAPNCTLYVASNGSANNTGQTPATAITLLRAADVAQAGDVVCIAPGTYDLSSTFYPAHSGAPDAWITYTRYGTGAVDIVWTGPASDTSTMIHMYSSTFPDGPSYLEFRGLTLDGRNTASDGFFCQGSHHLRFIDDTVENTGGAGIGSVECDYLTSIHNVIFHNGYEEGWTSGISYNSSQFFDHYDGLHNVVANNIVAGEYDSSSNHTDGNGIIMDLSNRTYDPSSANTPPALIVNNVVYGNGGRCIEDFTVTNIYVFNNTCYDNGLDLSLGAIGNIVSNSASTEAFANNIVQAWHSDATFEIEGQVSASTMIYSTNLIFGGTNQGISDTGFIVADPRFVSPPPYDPSADGQYAGTLDPARLGDDLDVQPGSPAIGAGVDPIALLGSASTDLKNDIINYVYTDIDGNPRPRGGPFDLGAYQH